MQLVDTHVGNAKRRSPSSVELLSTRSAPPDGRWLCCPSLDFFHLQRCRLRGNEPQSWLFMKRSTTSSRRSHRNSRRRDCVLQASTSSSPFPASDKPYLWKALRPQTVFSS